MKIYVILTFFIFTKALGVNLLQQEINNKINAHMATHKKYMREKFQGYCKGQGSGRFDDLESLRLEYQFLRQASIEEARRIFVESQEAFLDLFQQDKEIRLYLHEYPVTP